jgi:hypothetical protein
MTTPKPTDLVCLLYASTASDDDPDLRQIVEDCRRENALHDVTGLLLYHDGRFLQCLEGGRGDVLSTFERIKGDPRHHDVTLLSVEEIAERRFPDFAMSFQRVDADQFNGDFPAYSGLLETAFARKTLESNPDSALQIILAFAQMGMR